MQNDKSKTDLPFMEARVKKRTKFSSPFKNKVYEIVRKIPKGRVMSYKIIARLAGHPRAWRAVGNVLNKNRDLHPPKFSTKTLAGKQIPCHRVIRSNGKIGGYNRGIKKKIALLKREGVKIKNKKAIF